MPQHDESAISTHRHAPLVTVNAAPACPFCGASTVERVGQWGGQIITSQWRCLGCSSYFEAVRDDFDDQREGESP